MTSTLIALVVTLGYSELLTNQAESVAPLALTYLAFNSVPLALVIDELLLLRSHQLRIALRASQSRAAQTDSVTLAESTI